MWCAEKEKEREREREERNELGKWEWCGNGRCNGVGVSILASVLYALTW